MLDYGQAFKYQREINKKTLLQVEKETGISNANLSRWENNKILPNIDFCVKLADYYGITLDELVGRDHGREDSPSIYNEIHHNSIVNINQRRENKK